MHDCFVFGSNLAGRHGKGAALEAYRYWGAKPGIGSGRTGDSYAIPTKDERLQTLPLDVIEVYIEIFINYARANPDIRFILTPIGTGLAGYSKKQIRDIFRKFSISENVLLTASWLD